MSLKGKNSGGERQGAARKTNGKNNGIPKNFGPCRVLVADDEHLVATGIANNARDLGHTIVGIAPDGDVAVTLARQHKPDLVLMDIKMPKMNGIDAAMLIYSELSVPSIIISAYADEEYIGKIHGHGESAGVFGYLIKPVSREQLSVELGVALQRAAVDTTRVTRIGQLENNLAQRRLVEQAKWILVQKRGIIEPEAHDLLQKAARDQRRTLAEIAQGVIDHGDLV